MKQKPTEEELAYLIGNEELTTEECDSALATLLSRGDAIVCGYNKDGEIKFRLTPQGEAKAEKMFKKAREDLANLRGLQ